MANVFIQSIAGSCFGKFEELEQERYHRSQVDEESTGWRETCLGSRVHHEKGAA